MNKIELQKFVLENPNLVSMKETSKPNVFVLKYKKKVFYKGLWNEYLEECRGTIVDKDFNIISRPFTKIYNYGIEDRSPVIGLKEMVDVYRKVNGFMVAVTLYEDDLLVSTTGSIDSDFVKMALQMIDREKYLKVCRDYPDTTFLFECVHKSDPHIIPEVEGMYLIGFRSNSWDCYADIWPNMLLIAARKFGCFYPEHFRCALEELLMKIKDCKHEGFVFYTDEGISAKIKSPYYLIKKFVSRNPNTDKLMNKDIKGKIDEEYYPLINKIQENIEMFTNMDEQSRLKWVSEFLG